MGKTGPPRKEGERYKNGKLKPPPKANGRPRKEGPRYKCGKIARPQSPYEPGRPRIVSNIQIPEKQIILEQVLYWIDLQATQEEIAGSFRVSVETLDSRLIEAFGMRFSELRKRCSGQAKLALRRYQFEQAKKSATMAIWLGKQWIGQKDDIQLVQAPNHDLIISLLNEVKSLKGKMKEYKEAQDNQKNQVEYEKEGYESQSHQESGVNGDEGTSRQGSWEGSNEEKVHERSYEEG